MRRGALVEGLLLELDEHLVDRLAGVLDDRLVRQADTEIEAAIGQLVHRERLLGELALARRGGGKGDPGVVVDDLPVDVLVAAEHRQAGTRCGAVHALTNAEVAVAPGIGA